ncbi:hypothetical protein IFVP18_C1150218 [Vibrio parahaemolyticus]
MLTLGCKFLKGLFCLSKVRRSSSHALKALINQVKFNLPFCCD